MKLPAKYTLKDIAELIQSEYQGSPEMLVTGLNEIHRVEQGDIVFVDHPKYYDKALKSRATVILIDKRVECPEGKALLISQDPFRDYNKLVSYFKKNVLSMKLISDTARVGKSSVILPGTSIGEDVTIGENCLIYPNVVIYNGVRIGNNVTIHSGSIIGADAFYYKRRAEKFDKMISCGGVVIHDEVEIGALCTIDRGVSSDTVIGKGTKIDNHVQVGHDTIVGEMCLFAAHVGIAGMVTIEDKVTLWGQVGVPSNIIIGKGAVVLAQSGLSNSIEPGSVYFGSPAVEARKKMRELAILKKLPELMNNIRNTGSGENTINTNG